MKKIKTVMAFLLAVVMTFLLASIVGTQIVLSDIRSFGLIVSLPDRFSATLHDIIGLAPALSILVSAAFLVSFIIATLCTRFLGGKRTYWYLAAGFTCLPAALMLIKSTMGGTLFAAARTGSGMLLIALCGLLGGWVFARWSQKRDA